jgi:hypothetical protein
MLPPERRLGRVLELIDDRKYFTLHSGRQTGKTTCAFWLVDHLNAAGRYQAAWVDLQTAREQPELDRALPIILSELDRATMRDHPGAADAHRFARRAAARTAGAEDPGTDDLVVCKKYECEEDRDQPPGGAVRRPGARAQAAAVEPE